MGLNRRAALVQQALYRTGGEVSAEGGEGKMNVIPIGSLVYLVGSRPRGFHMPAFVTAVCIRDSGVTYECVWWNGEDRKCEWISRGEIFLEDGTHVQVRNGHGSRFAPGGRRIQKDRRLRGGAASGLPALHGQERVPGTPHHLTDDGRSPHGITFDCGSLRR